MSGENFYYLVFLKDKEIPEEYKEHSLTVIQKNKSGRMAVVKSKNDIDCSKLLNIKKIKAFVAEDYIIKWYFENY